MNCVQCPICDARMPADWSEYPDYPFCSKRCRTIDLGRWLNEDYKVGRAQQEPDENRSTPTSDDAS